MTSEIPEPKNLTNLPIGCTGFSAQNSDIGPAYRDFCFLKTLEVSTANASNWCHGFYQKINFDIWNF